MRLRSGERVGHKAVLIILSPTPFQKPRDNRLGVWAVVESYYANNYANNSLTYISDITVIA